MACTVVVEQSCQFHLNYYNSHTRVGFLDAHGCVKLQVRLSNAQKEPPKDTSLAFLNFMKELNVAFFQDAAAMLAKCPHRQNHPLYQIPCLASPQFQVRFIPCLHVYLYTCSKGRNRQTCLHVHMLLFLLF